MDLHEALARATMTRDEAEGRVYGWLPGIVTDVDTKLMRVRARVGKQGDNESTDWLVQIGMGSVESLPEVGDPVGVLFMDGDIHRGAFFYFPQSTTKGRPTQHMVLGDMLVGMFNFFVTQFNQLLSDFNNHTHTVSNVASIIAPAGTAGGACSGSLAVPSPSASTALQANKGKASDGSVVSNQTSSAIVLSKRSLVR